MLLLDTPLALQTVFVVLCYVVFFSMIRRPPRATRTDTRGPDTTLFRSPAALAHCARLAEQWGYDEVNLNCGCPSERVQRGSFGACLMAEPALVADCVRSEEHTSELQSLMRISYAVFCLNKKIRKHHPKQAKHAS